MNTAASVARLCEIKDVTEEDARLIRAIWKARGADAVAATDPKRWAAAQAAGGNLRDNKRHMVDSVLNTCGVEFLGIHKRTDQRIYYCNAGDTYATTVIFDGGRLVVGCWGDYADKVKPFEQP